MKRKTCASVLALILTCAMVTGSLPVEANAAEAAAASELTAVQDESQEQAEVTDETKEAGDETAGEQEQVTEPGQEEEKQAREKRLLELEKRYKYYIDLVNAQKRETLKKLTKNC